MSQILIVDDDAVSRLVLRLLLERRGHQVVEEPNAKSALDSLRATGARQPGMIISDQDMPGMSGTEFRAALGETLAIPFVLLTGYAGEEEFEAAGELGDIDAFLTKPIGSQAIDDLAQQFLPSEHDR